MITVLMWTGIVIAAIGVILLALSSRWVKSWGDQYATTNMPAACLGWLLLAVGFALLVGPAVFTGQLS
ncbi:hypothetical protein ACFQS2_03255 [Brachybacterium sp. GCM10030267]|uniref:hypothetical protein n=1 Tax=unclassified Brachybacterium TaxID=2623841 RepID=UPI00360800A0